MRIITLAACLLLAQSTIATDLPGEEKKIKDYIFRAFELRNSAYDSSMQILGYAETLSVNNKSFDMLLKEVKLTKAIVYSANKEDSAALNLLIEIEDILPETQNSLKIYGYWAFASAYFKIGLVGKGNIYFQKLMDDCELSQTEELDVLIDWASNNAKRGYYNRGLKLFEEAYTKATDYKLSDHKIDISRYLSNVYGRKKDFKKATEFAYKSVEHYLNQDDLIKLGDSYLSLAGTFYQSADYDSALHYYKVSEEIYKNGDSELGLAYAYINMSEVLMIMEQSDSVLYYLNSARAHANAAGASARLTTYIDLKLVGYFVGEEAWDVAIKYMSNLENNAILSGDLEMLKETYYNLFVIYNNLNEKENALNYFQKYHTYSDSINNSSTEREYAKLRFAVEALEKENEIQDLQFRVEKAGSQRLIIVTVAILLLTIVLLAAFIYRSRSINARLRLKNTLLEKKWIQEQLGIKEKELTDQTISMIHKNRFLDELSDTLRDAKTSLNGDPVRVINKSIQAINRNKSSEKDWENFNKYFGSVHHDFFDSLKKKYPNLSNGDLRHCALVKMNLSTKESAELLGVSPQSIKMARYRAKKKMGLCETDNLGQYLLEV